MSVLLEEAGPDLSGLNPEIMHWQSAEAVPVEPPVSEPQSIQQEAEEFFSALIIWQHQS